MRRPWRRRRSVTVWIDNAPHGLEMKTLYEGDTLTIDQATVLDDGSPIKGRLTMTSTVRIVSIT